MKLRALVLFLSWCVSVHASERGLEPVFLYYIKNGVKEQIKASLSSPHCSDECCQLKQISFGMRDVYAFLSRVPEGKSFVDEFRNAMSKTTPVEIRYLNSLSERERNELIELGHDPDGLFGAYIEPNVIGNKNHLFLLTSGLNLMDAALLIVHEGHHRMNRDKNWSKKLKAEGDLIQNKLIEKYGNFGAIQNQNDQNALQASLGIVAIHGYIDEFQAYQRENKVRQQFKNQFPCIEGFKESNAEVFDLEHSSERARLFHSYFQTKTRDQIDAALEWVEKSDDLKKEVEKSQVPLTLIRKAVEGFQGFEPNKIRF